MSSKSASDVLARLDRAIYLFSRATAGFSLIAMFCVVVMLVLARYIAKAPVFWGEELSRYCMFYMIMLGSAVAVRENRHLRLTIITDVFPPVFARWWERFLDVLLLVISLVLIYQGLDIAIEDGVMLTPALRVAFFWIYLAFPIGGVLMLAQVVGKQFLKVEPSQASREEI